MGSPTAADTGLAAWSGRRADLSGPRFRHLANRCARPLINVVWPLPPVAPEPPEVVTLKREVKALSWFHSIDLGHGVITPGCEPTAEKLRRLGLPEDLTGRTVLDVGAYDGFFSFEAERRGAARVLATDSVCWEGAGGARAGPQGHLRPGSPRSAFARRIPTPRRF